MFIAEEKKNYPSRKKKSAGRNSDKCTKMEMNKIMGRRGKKERKKKKPPPRSIETRCRETHKGPVLTSIAKRVCFVLQYAYFIFIYFYLLNIFYFGFVPFNMHQLKVLTPLT